MSRCPVCGCEESIPLSTNKFKLTCSNCGAIFDAPYSYAWTMLNLSQIEQTTSLLDGIFKERRNGKTD